MVRNRINFKKTELKNLNNSNTYVDMHFHSRYSFDSSALIKNIAKKCIKYNFGVAITDHDEIKGAVELSKNKDVFLVPGIEVRCDRGFHTLLYFYQISELVEFFEKHIKPTLKNKKYHKTDAILNFAENYNCISTIAHPYAPGLTSIFNKAHKKYVNEKLIERYDSIEVIQGCNIHKCNLQAVKLASELKKGITAGSDGHTTSNLAEALTYFKEEKDVESFLNSIKKNKSHVIGKGKLSIKNTISHLGKVPGWVTQTKYYASKVKQNVSRIKENLDVKKKKKRFVKKN